jgi:hypothetical protein
MSMVKSLLNLYLACYACLLAISKECRSWISPSFMHTRRVVNLMWYYGLSVRMRVAHIIGIRDRGPFPQNIISTYSPIDIVAASWDTTFSRVRYAHIFGR